MHDIIWFIWFTEYIIIDMITETGKTEVEKTEFEDGIRKARNRN